MCSFFLKGKKFEGCFKYIDLESSKQLLVRNYSYWQYVGVGSNELKSNNLVAVVVKFKLDFK